MWRIKRKKKMDNDPRSYISKDISLDEFAKVYDETFQYREKVLPEAFTLEFWEKNDLVRLTLESGHLKNDILDVGCGSGEIDIIYGMKGYHVCGLDISQYAIEIAEKHLKNHPQLSGKIRFINGNIEEIDLTDRFNTAIIFHTLEHVINPHRTLEQTIRFLNPGAKILVEVPYKKSYRDRTDLRHFSPRKLRGLLSAFSNSVEVIHFKERRTIYAVVELQ
ncbi:MAG: class I SAM-dependent methyltransferase [Thermodesulfobacteriota bacterium]|nr:class I SAM-dependent methyltransferase [Thermodesulfobacteriota bacterium]